jgi:glycosyltransferase involved in cell wall biosynthesis
MPGLRVGIDAHAAERDGSGNCTYIRNLLTGLAELGGEHRIFLYVTDARHPFYRSIRRAGFFSIRPLTFRSPFLRIPLELAARSVRDRLDLLHVQFNAPPLHRGRLVAAVHDLAFLHEPGSFSRLQRARLKLLTPRTARRAAVVITGSRYSEADIRESYGVPPDRIRVLPYGVAPIFRPRPRDGALEAALRRSHIERPYLLSVGRLNPRKNLPVLIRAFLGARERGRLPHSLVIAGKADFQTRGILDQISLASDSSAVRQTGFVAEEDLPLLYAGADAFLYLSLFEGVGLPVQEAMACGVPVITSRTTSLAEVAGDAALLVDPRSEGEIREAILRLLSDDGFRRSCVQRGLDRVRGNTPQAAARATLEVYRWAAGAF